MLEKLFDVYIALFYIAIPASFFIVYIISIYTTRDKELDEFYDFVINLLRYRLKPIGILLFLLLFHMLLVFMFFLPFINSFIKMIIEWLKFLLIKEGKWMEYQI